MRHPRQTGAVAIATAVTIGLCGAAPALASDASIRAAVRSATPTLNSDAAKLRAAIKAYDSSGNDAGVLAAIHTLTAEFSSLRAQVSSQSAHSATVKTARRKLVKGLGQGIVEYGRLAKAVSDKSAGHSAAAKREAAKAEAAGQKAIVNIHAAMMLLSDGM